MTYKVSKFRKLTGKTLDQWADEYNLSKERIRQLYKKWGTLNDDLLSGRPRDSHTNKVLPTSKYKEWKGLTKVELAQKYNTTNDIIQIWFEGYPKLSWEEFSAINNAEKNINYKKWQGLSLGELKKKYNVCSGRIRRWYTLYPNLSWEEYNQK